MEALLDYDEFCNNCGGPLRYDDGQYECLKCSLRYVKCWYCTSYCNPEPRYTTCPDCGCLTCSACGGEVDPPVGSHAGDDGVVFDWIPPVCENCGDV